MVELKGAPKKRGRHGGPVVPPRKPQVEEPEVAPTDPAEDMLSAQSGAEDLETPKKRARRLKAEEQEGVEEVEITLPRHIRIRNPSDVFKSIVPASVLRVPAFPYEPRSFVVDSDRLREKIILDSVQTRNLREWMADPTAPITYSVSGNPNDSKANLFAAYLLSIHMKKLGVKANPVWETLYGGFSDPKVLTRSENLGRPTILIISNLAINSVNSKIGKAQDLIEQFQSIPRIIVSAGEDPISFMSTRLHKPVQGIAYFSESLVKKTVQVI